MRRAVAVSLSLLLLLLAAQPSIGAPVLSAVTLHTGAVVGGNSATGTVTAGCTVTSKAVNKSATVTITAVGGGASAQATLTVNERERRQATTQGARSRMWPGSLGAQARPLPTPRA